MSTLHSGHLRDDLKMMRTSLAFGSVTAEADSPRHPELYTTHNEVAFASPGSLNDLRIPNSFIHKNLSQLPGFQDPPNDSSYFTTTAASSYTKMHSPPPPLTRYQSKILKEKTDIFGTATRKSEPTKSTAHHMGESGGHAPRKPQPRYVHGGAYRNTSQVALDRNLGPGAVTSFATTNNQLHSDPMGAHRPTHRFELPQKNASTFMSTSLTVAAAGPSAPPPGPSAGVSIGVREFATRTDHNDPHAALVKMTRPAHGHYNTSYGTHFMDRSGVPLVVPPGKGGHDMTKSTIPLGRDKLPTETAHTASMYTSAGPLPVRETCASRGSLGVRMRLG